MIGQIITQKKEQCHTYDRYRDENALGFCKNVAAQAYSPYIKDACGLSDFQL